METIFYILVVLGCLASIGSFVLLFFVAAFLVQFRNFVREFFSDLVNMIAGIEPPEPVVVKDESKTKTWDEKFEEELAERERRMRDELGGGLLDIDRPKENYAAPAAPNIQNQSGLIVRSREDNMR